MKRILFVIMLLLAGNVARAQWKFIGETCCDTTLTLNSFGSSSLVFNNEAFGYMNLYNNFNDCFRLLKAPDSIGYLSYYLYVDTVLLKTKEIKKLELVFNEGSEWNTYCASTQMQMFDYLGYVDTVEIKPNFTYSSMGNLPLPNKTKVLILKQDWGRRGPTINSFNFKNNLLAANNLHTLEIHDYSNLATEYSIDSLDISNTTLKKVIVKNSSIRIMNASPSQLEHLEITNNSYWSSYYYATTIYYRIPVIFTTTNFPESLKYLDLSNNILETILAFPPNLEYADLSVNKLTSLPQLPNSLKTLNAGGTGSVFVSVAEWSGKDSFTYYNNTFPVSDLSILPPKLEYLSFILSGSSRADLPYPSTLKSLYIQGNKLTKLPTLPSGLKNLGIGINGDSVALSVLNNYNLPSLEYFGFSYDKTSGTRQPLTIGLPSSLKTLNFSSKWFSSYPTYPSDLRSLLISDSLVNTLTKLPKNLSYLNVKECPALTCLPVLPSSLKTIETSLGCIPNYTDFIRTGTICNVSKICDAGDYGRLGGKVFVDLNNDGIFNGTDINIPQVIVSNSNPGNNFYSSTFTDGNFQMLLDTTGTNTLKITATPYLYTTLTPDSINVTPNGNAYLGNSYNFRMVPKPNVNDLSIFVTADGTPPRPGFDAWVKVIAKNKGTVDVSNAEIKLVKPTDWTLVSSSINPTSVSGDTLIWKNQSMGKLVGTKDVNLQFSIPQTAVLGSAYQIKGTVTPTVSDSVPSDNVSIFNGIIVGSYDPNDKQVNPENLLPDYGDSTRLTYLIRFQNTGTFYAENVIITDSLPDNVDPATIEVKAASHPYTFSMHERGEIAFIFNGIMLPDSNTNEALSHGYVLFTVKPKKGLALGEKVENKAFIYFDYNDAIITNKAITELRIPSGIQGRNELIAKIYPNPTSTETKIELSESVNGKVWLYNLQGAVVSKTVMENGKSTIETGTLQNGIYLIVIETEQGSAAAKLMVQH